MVKSIKSLRTKIKLHALPDWESAPDCRVKIPIARTVNGVSTERSVSAQWLGNKCARVIPRLKSMNRRGRHARGICRDCAAYERIGDFDRPVCPDACERNIGAVDYAQWGT